MARILPTRSEETAIRDKMVEKIYGIERPGLFDYYLDALDMAATGGIATIARKAAKLGVVKSLRKYFGANPKDPVTWNQVKSRFKTHAKVLDETPQYELDVLNTYRTEHSVGELNKRLLKDRPDLKMPKGATVAGIHNPDYKEVILGGSLKGKEIPETVRHEFGHVGDILGRKNRSTKTKQTQAFLQFASKAERVKNPGLYLEDPKEVYAENFRGNLASGLPFETAHDTAAADTLSWYLEELADRGRRK